MLQADHVSTYDCRATTVLSILVVEDEDLIRMCVTEFLQDYGYDVEAAANVMQAKVILAEKPVELVFSDVNMPGGENGFALEKWIRRHYPDTKVLLTSGFPHLSADVRGLSQPLIPKPYTCASILERVQRLFKPA